KPSEFKQLHIKTVKHEQDVTMECNISEVKNKNTLSCRFSVTLKDQKFDLNINNLREDDGGEYFCGEVDENSLKFTSGTRLQFEGKTADMKNLHVKTVKLGDDVIMQCNINGLKNKNSLAWYRQSFEKVPQVFARQFEQSYTFTDGFTDSRFSVAVNDQKFNININGIREDDGGEYFCGYVEGSTLKFTSGTRLQFEGSTSDSKGLQMKTVKRGGNVTVECTGFKNKTNIVWYRLMSGEMPQFFAKYYRNAQGYTFADGFTDKRFSFTVNDQKFDLNIKEIIEKDKGEYFCGELDGMLKFTSGTRLQFEGEEKKLCPTPGTLNNNTHSVTHQGSNSRDAEENNNWITALIASNTISVIVIIILVGVLFKHQRK
ncbi:putative immune-type receptor 7 precursor, partial [Clarias magur]